MGEYPLTETRSVKGLGKLKKISLWFSQKDSSIINELRLPYVI